MRSLCRFFMLCMPRFWHHAAPPSPHLAATLHLLQDKLYRFWKDKAILGTILIWSLGEALSVEISHIARDSSFHSYVLFTKRCFFKVESVVKVYLILQIG